MRAFVALTEKGSVTGAARALGVAQSTVSEALASLERAVASPLLQRRRGTRGAALTDAGQALLPHARQVLAAVDGLHLAVADAVSSARGAVDIIANESISTYVLPRALARARERWPNTQFSISAAMCPDVRHGVSEGAFDVGLLLEAVTARDERRRKASSTARLPASDIVAPLVRLVAFSLPSHPLARTPQGVVERKRIAEFPLFLSDSAGDFRVLIERFFRSDGLRGARIQSTGTVEGVKRGVFVDRRAVGILPSYAIANELASGRVVALTIRPALPLMRILALFSPSRQRHPGVDQLLDDVRGPFAAARSTIQRPRARSVS